MGELRAGEVVIVDGIARVVVPMVALGYPDDRALVPGPVWVNEIDRDRQPEVVDDVFAEDKFAENSVSDDDQENGGDSGLGHEVSGQGNEE